MNINLEYPLFRFIVPPSIFYGILLFSNVNIHFSYNPDSLIIFVALGFIISAIGTLIARLIDFINRPAWYNPTNEIEYWTRVGDRKEYLRNKIENVWGFYSMNINVCVSILSATTIILFLHSGVQWYFVLGLFILLMLFSSLAALSYKKIFNVGEIYSKK